MLRRLSRLQHYYLYRHNDSTVRQKDILNHLRQALDNISFANKPHKGRAIRSCTTEEELDCKVRAEPKLIIVYLVSSFENFSEFFYHFFFPCIAVSGHFRSWIIWCYMEEETWLRKSSYLEIKICATRQMMLQVHVF